MFKQQGGDKISPQERFKLFTFAYSGEGELMDTPTPDIENDLRFPNAQSGVSLLNSEIKKFSYEEETDGEESTWESLVDEEDDSSEDSLIS